MNNLPPSQDQQLDNQLSEFTDRLLAGKKELRTPETVNESELEDLKKSVRRMKAATQQALPDAAVTARVRSRVLGQWKQTTRQPGKSIFKGFFQPLPRFAMASGLVVMLILITGLFFPTTVPLIATAEGFQSWAPVLILTGVVAIIVLLWMDRRH
jgi:hypothetical protein